MSHKVLIQYITRYFSDRKEPYAFAEQIDEQMVAYEEIEQQRQKDRLELASKVDDEGFVTVVNTKTSVFKGEEERVEMQSEAERRAKKKLRRDQDVSFYNSSNSSIADQDEEEEISRAAQLNSLKEQFEQDKKKLAALKAFKKQQ